MDTVAYRRASRHIPSAFVMLLAMLSALLLVSCSGKADEGSSTATPTAQESTATRDDDKTAATTAGEDSSAATTASDQPETSDGADADVAQNEKDTKPTGLSATRLARGEEIRSDLQAAADASGMTCCVSLVDLSDGLAVSCRGDQQMASASMIKLLIAYSFLEQVQAGAYELDDYYTIKGSDIVGGTGTLCGLGAGAQVTYRDIITRMIDVSDNTGANIIIDACGMDTINATAQRLGLAKTVLNRHMMDSDAMAAGLENYTCADDVAKLLQMAYEGTFVDEASSNLMMEALRQQQDWGGIRNGLPSDVSFAHKTGALDTVRHDGGIVEGSHPFVLVVLCGGEGFWEQGAHNAMAKVAQVAYADMID